MLTSRKCLITVPDYGEITITEFGFLLNEEIAELRINMFKPQYCDNFVRAYNSGDPKEMVKFFQEYDQP